MYCNTLVCITGWEARLAETVSQYSLVYCGKEKKFVSQYKKIVLWQLEQWAAGLCRSTGHDTALGAADELGRAGRAAGRAGRARGARGRRQQGRAAGA